MDSLTNDEESFVVLGTSPPSMDNFDSIMKNEKRVMEMSCQTDATYQSIQMNESKTESLTASAKLDEKNINSDSLNEKSNELTQIQSTINDLSQMITSAIRDVTITSQNNVGSDDKIAIQIKGSEDMNKSNSLPSTTMIDKFLIESTVQSSGDIQSNVFEAFPSLYASKLTEADIQKLQTLICEHIKLKENLQKTNSAMRQHFLTIDDWRQAAKSRRDDLAKELLIRNDVIEKLSNEISQLKHELDDKNQTLELNKDTANEEKYQFELQISKLEATIQEMEKSAFDVINNESLAISKTTKTNTISVEEYENLVKQLKSELSNLLAENLEIQDMKKTYIDELDCLRVNLTSAEELLNESNAKNSTLEARKIELEEMVKTLNENSNENLKSLQDKLTVTEKQLHENIAENSLLADKNAVLNKLIEEKDQTILKFAVDLERLKNSNVSSDGNLQRLQNELIAAEKQLNESIAENALLAGQNADLKKLIEEKDQTIVKFAADLERIKNSNEISDEKLIQTQSNLTDTEEQLKQSMVENESLKAKTVNFEKMVNENNERIASLQNDIETMIQMKQNEPKSTENTLTKESNNDKMYKEGNSVTKMTQKKIELGKTVDEINKLSFDLTEENNILRQQRDIYINELKNRQSSLDNLKKLYQENITELQKITAESTQLENTLKERDADISELKFETKMTLHMYEDQIQTFKSQLSDAQKQLMEQVERTDYFEKQNTELTNVIGELKEEVVMYKEQLDVYKNDFECEKKCRLDVTNERDEILSDLKLLQRRNEQLMKDKSQMPSPTASASSKSSTPSGSPSTYTCPFCMKTYGNFSVLETHVQICLMNSGM